MTAKEENGSVRLEKIFSLRRFVAKNNSWVKPCTYHAVANARWVSFKKVLARISQISVNYGEVYSNIVPICYNYVVICCTNETVKMWPCFQTDLHFISNHERNTHVFYTQSVVGNNMSLKICIISIRCYKYWRQCNTRQHRAYRTLLKCFNGRVGSSLPANQMSGHSNKYSNHLNSGISNFTCLYV